MTIDDLVCTIKTADEAYVAWQDAIRQRARCPSGDPFGDDVAAMETRYERAKQRADRAMAQWSCEPWKVTRPAPSTTPLPVVTEEERNG